MQLATKRIIIALLNRPFEFVQLASIKLLWVSFVVLNWATGINKWITIGRLLKTTAAVRLFELVQQLASIKLIWEQLRPRGGRPLFWVGATVINKVSIWEQLRINESLFGATGINIHKFGNRCGRLFELVQLASIKLIWEQLRMSPFLVQHKLGNRCNWHQ